MRTLVCQAKGLLSTVKVYPDPETTVEGEFEAWSLRTGKQVMCVERGLHRLLARHHLGGTYETGALYAFEYDDMCAVLRDQLGPSDRERYLELSRGGKPRGTPPLQWHPIALMVWRSTGVLLFVVYKTLATVVVFGVVAMFLALFKKHK